MLSDYDVRDAMAYLERYAHGAVPQMATYEFGEFAIRVAKFCRARQFERVRSRKHYRDRLRYIEVRDRKKIAARLLPPDAECLRPIERQTDEQAADVRALILSRLETLVEETTNG